MAGKRVSSSNSTKKDKSIQGQVKQFAKDSQMFLDKCNKPNREGMSHFLGFYFVGFVVYTVLRLYLTLHKYRVHEDPECMLYRFCSDGLHRLLHQADLHPNQQYHFWEIRRQLNGCDKLINTVFCIIRQLNYVWWCQSILGDANSKLMRLLWSIWKSLYRFFGSSQFSSDYFIN